MRDKLNEPTGGNGHLPAVAPLANPYVPFQLNNPPMYEPRTGLIKGTLFPGLDLPFMGLVNNIEKPVTPLSELQAMAFVIQELALYLDTHQTDIEALDVYQQMQKMYRDAMHLYEKTYGPLTHTAITQGPFKWLDGPWPWEYCMNQEA